jgi:hypothetical protein
MMTLVRFALGVGAAVMLAACSSTSPTAASGALPQSAAIAVRADRGGSWMLPGTQSESLLYVSGLSGHTRAVKVFKFPDGGKVGELTGFGFPAGLCSDGAGNVFVTDPGKNDIVEFAHGSTTPITTLPNQEALVGCSVDPTTGNLAATGAENGIHQSTVAVYPWSGSAFGAPITYTDSSAKEFEWCAYDANGNLFASGTKVFNASVLDELPRGGSQLVPISEGGSIGGDGAVQWDGQYLALEDPSAKAITIYQLVISGSSASIAHTIKLGTRFKGRPGVSRQFWIQSGEIASADGGHDVGVWSYPAGGKPTKSIYALSDQIGVTVSSASP